MAELRGYHDGMTDQQDDGCPPGKFRSPISGRCIWGHGTPGMAQNHRRKPDVYGTLKECPECVDAENEDRRAGKQRARLKTRLEKETNK